MPNIKLPVIRIRQNDWDMYFGKINAADLYNSSTSDRIRLEELEIPKYAGFQRPLVESRVNEIKDFLSTPDANFPNSIIVTLDSESIVDWQEVKGHPDVGCIEVKPSDGAFTIIDGQHRTAALIAASPDFEVLVTIFVDLDIKKCAQIFAKINSTQKAVNPSIAFQLFGYSDKRSPQRTAHDIAVIMNVTDGSPFYKKIKMLGSRDEWANGNLSQSTFAKHLMRLYTTNPGRDENRLLRSQLMEDDQKIPLRSYFIKERDKDILKLVWNYFLQIAKTWPEQWDDTSGKSVLVKTTGFASFMEILLLWLRSEHKDELLKNKGIEERFKKCQAFFREDANNFIRENYPAGHQGVVKLREILKEEMRLI